MKRIVAILTASLSLGPARPTQAAPQAARPGPKVRAPGDSSRRAVVMIASRGRPAKSKQAIGVIRSQLGDLPVRLHVEWVDRLTPTLPAQVRLARTVAAREKAVAVFWVDLSVPDQLFLYLAEPGGGRILVRNLGADPKVAEGRLEAMAFIVRSAVRAMLAGARIGVRAPPEVAKKPPVKPARKKATKRITVSVAYAMQTFSSATPLAHGARLGVGVAILRWLSAFAAYRLTPSIRRASASVAMDLRPHPIEVGVLFGWRFGRWSFAGGGGVVVDYQTWSVVEKRTNVMAVSPYSRWLVGLFPYLTGAFQPTSYSSVFISAAVDIPLNHRSFVVESAAGYEPLLDPWKARPWFLIGAAFLFL